MLLNTNHLLYGITMCLVCLFFRALVLTCSLVLVAFCYNQMVRSDGRMLKRCELHWTDATGWLLFKPLEGVCPTIMAENPVLYQQGHSVSEPWNFWWKPLLHLCGGCLVVPVLLEICIHPVLLFSVILTTHCPICAYWELFLIFAVLVSFSDRLTWDLNPCDSWWAWLVSHCCQFRPLPWCICFLVAGVLGSALSGWRRQCFLTLVRWCIRRVPCVLVVLLC